MSEAELTRLVALLKSAGLTGPHLEIGTAAGGTLKELMRSYDDAARPRFVVTDPFTYYPDQRAIVDRNLRSAGLDPDSVDFRVGFSWPLLAPALAAKERFSFIFIDGDHSELGVMRDLRWTRLLDVGGYVCLHDVRPRYPGLGRALRRFLAKNSNYQQIDLVDSLAILRKVGPSARPEVSDLDLLAAHFLNRLSRLRRSIAKRLPKPAAPTS
jgi:predicted O-methyltransferase YrrM